MAEKNAWLLTWNPKKSDEEGRDGTPGGFLGIKEGEEKTWGCGSKQPKVGDTVYMLRQGKEPRGIVAKGEVTKESFMAETRTYPKKEVRSISFKLLESREVCSEGLLSRALLIMAFPSKGWSPQQSGISVGSNIVEEISNLWEEGRDKSSLRQFVDYYAKNIETTDDKDWLNNYRDIIDQVHKWRDTKSNELTDGMLSTLWEGPWNGITSVGQGAMTKREYSRSQELLKDMTSKIVNDPTPATGRLVYSKWKDATEAKRFAKIRWAVIHRVFAAAAPDKYTTALRDEACKEILDILGTQFQIDNDKSGDWFELNAEIVRCMQEAGLESNNLEKVLVNNMVMWELIKTKSSKSNNDSVLDAGGDESVESKSTGCIALNQILYGPPGTGKTYATTNKALEILDPDFLQANSGSRDKIKDRYDELKSDGRIEFVTFHQSFSYEDFVEGLKAERHEEGGGIHYPIEKGVFKRICERCDDGLPHVLIIDEINRGNIANIFGELITLIEPSKRKGASEALTVTLPYSKEKGGPFSVPGNLYIIGTMNTADRSLVLVDTALRRRFRFVEMMPNTSLLADIEIDRINIRQMVDVMNQRIELLYDREHTLGHSFFLPMKNIENPGIEQLADIFESQILPLLEEYFFEDWSRIQQVLGDDQKDSSDKNAHFYVEKFERDEVERLLGSAARSPGHDVNGDERIPYKRNANALKNPSAYIGIYEPPASGKRDGTDESKPDDSNESTEGN